jgi:hypothetical protein
MFYISWSWCFLSFKAKAGQNKLPFGNHLGRPFRLFLHAAIFANSADDFRLLAAGAWGQVREKSTASAFGESRSGGDGRRIESSWRYADGELVRLIRIAESA